MNLLKNWTNLIEKARSLDAKSLESIEIAIFGVIILDIFVVWYLLEFKKFAVALLIVSLIFLAIILVLIKNLPEETKKEVKKKMDEEKIEEELKEQEQPKAPESDFDFGLPTAEEFQERARKALGSMDNF